MKMLRLQPLLLVRRGQWFRTQWRHDCASTEIFTTDYFQEKNPQQCMAPFDTYIKFSIEEKLWDFCYCVVLRKIVP